MNILTFNSECKLNEAGAALIASVVQTKPRAVLGLATGGTPVGIYEQLVKKHREGMVSFKQVASFNLDEYVGINPAHEQSYLYYMQQHLFNHIDISPERCNIPFGRAEDLEQECLRYEQAIAESGQIDIQLLGLGHNGHVGFNEPGNELVSGTHVVELAEETRNANARYFESEEQVPRYAITMGIGSILKSKMILLVVKGEDKAEIVQRALQGPITTSCPASLLQTHANLVVLLDEAAGSKLV
jgi:glucosamine-6-phosphate deaminase